MKKLLILAFLFVGCGETYQFHNEGLLIFRMNTRTGNVEKGILLDSEKKIHWIQYKDEIVGVTVGIDKNND